MFQGLFKSRVRPIQPADVLAHRAELGLAPSRIVDSFSAFARPDQTVQAVPIDDYLHLLKEPIDVLRHEIGSDTPTFDRLVMPMLQRYLAWVHLLPASANHHHARLGGLAIHGLDVAALSARSVHNAVLDFEPAYTRDLELKQKRSVLWPLAAAVAGLHHDLGKVLIDQLVTCASTGVVWNPFVCDLLTWAKSQDVECYAMRFRPGDRLHRHESFGLLLLGQIAGPEVLGALSGLGRDMLEAITMAVSGEREDAAGLRTMVHKADAASSRMDRDAGQAYWSEGSSNVDPIVGRLLDAAQTLIRKRIWKINTPGHPLWVTGDGAYLVWPQAFNSMRQELVAQQKAVGVPADPVEVAEVFIRARIAMGRELSNGQRVPLWSLHLPGAEPLSAPAESPYAELMARMAGVQNALFLPDPTPLVQGVAIAESNEVRVARDPTIPQVVETPATPEGSATVEMPADIPPPDAGLPTIPIVTADGAMVAPAPAPEQHVSAGEDRASGKDAVSTVAPPELSASTAPEAEARAPLPVAAVVPSDVAIAGVPAPSEALPEVEDDDTVHRAEVAARETLHTYGQIGRVLEHIADKIALEPGSYPARERVTMKGDTLVLRWPDAMKGETRDVRALAEELAANPGWIAARFNGQPVNVAANGITVSARIRGGAWNAVPLCDAISLAFQQLARRNTPPPPSNLP